jgi:hypothetical protein
MVRVDSIYMSFKLFGLRDLRTILSFVETCYTKLKIEPSEVTRL